MRGVTGRERLIRKSLLYLTETTAGASAPELPPMKRMEAIIRKIKKKIVTETEIENESGLVIARRIGTIEIRIEKRIASESGVVERKRRTRKKREIRRERRRGGREIKRKRGRERGKRERRKKRKKGLGEAGAGRSGTGTAIEKEREKET